ncbi:protein of unknown function [Lacicoccus qingdaonensis]|uniref:IrrE N-terminal-like domain-containing protein n=2 Tax=Lacicoccus qingdaonensis TaxID=576118 RepID=A0A1G9EYJ8_9BACL|nr:protein of unknown function [Salinicoccus qingdaonensis]
MSAHNHINFKEVSFLPAKLDGLLMSDTIFINEDLDPHEKNAIVAEEIGHYYTVSSRITDYENMNEYKYELKGRRLGYEFNVPIQKIIECYELGLSNIHEMAEHLELPEEYICEALKHYEIKYQNKLFYKDCLITFNPLKIIED